MEIPGLGPVTRDERIAAWYRSEPMAVPVLGNKKCKIVVNRYDEDPNKDEIHQAIANFLSIGPDVLKEAEPYVFEYYQDCNADWEPDDDEYVKIKSAKNVYKHVQFGSEPMVTRRGYGDKGIYVELSCNCDWEPEHGLVIVFKNGLKVNKVGAYDGHVTNSDAYADAQLEDVIYRSRR